MLWPLGQGVKANVDLLTFSVYNISYETFTSLLYDKWGPALYIHNIYFSRYVFVFIKEIIYPLVALVRSFSMKWWIIFIEVIVTCNDIFFLSRKEILVYICYIALPYKVKVLIILMLRLECPRRTSSTTWLMMPWLYYVTLPSATMVGIDCIGWIFLCLPCGVVSSTCIISISRNDRGCKYLFMFPENHPTHKCMRMTAGSFSTISL